MKILSVLSIILLFSVFAFAQKSPIVVYLAGDSTLAERSWKSVPKPAGANGFSSILTQKK